MLWVVPALGCVGGGGSTGSGGSNTGGGAGGASGGAGGVPGTSAGTPGVWQDVTPAGINLAPGASGGGFPDNYGVQDIVADPVRPADLYAFVCYQGVWRSTDYGLTWQQANPGANWQKPWAAAIDPSKSRDPQRAPALYAGNSAAIGFLASTDWGVTWTARRLPDSFGNYAYQQVYSIDVDPYDSNHLIIGFHEAPDMAESTDGGMTWKKITGADADAQSYCPYFLDTGSAATTRRTWLVVPQINTSARAVRTVDGGATWMKLNQFQHYHGSSQIFDAGKGVVYMGAVNPNGLWKSTDLGATWTKVATGSAGVVTASARYLYSNVGLGWGSPGAPLDPELMSARRDADTSWTKTPAPSGMVDGSKRMAVTHDGAHAIVVAGNWHAGIWRYVEP